MQRLPYLDIVEPDRITQLLSDPANFAWRAVDSETLDGFVPDLGLTHYTHPSIYRPPSVAAAGLPSQMRQRFWDTVEKQCDHTGWRYLGLVIYAAAGQPHQMEFRLGADEIGEIDVQRADNRRYLIVLDHPVQFIGEMEVLQLRVAGPGTYRIEYFVLLKERPSPSSFAPHITQTTVRWQAQPDDRFTATLQWITAQVAGGRLSVHPTKTNDPPFTVEATTVGRLHTIHLPNLRRTVEYTFQITATEPLGEQATAILQASAPLPSPVSSTLTVPIEVFAPTGLANFPLPLTVGVPLAAGRIFAAEHCTLQSANTHWPAQPRPLAYWPDGSLRWLLLDANLPLPSSPTPLQVQINSEREAPATLALSWQEHADTITITSNQLRVEQE